MSRPGAAARYALPLTLACWAAGPVAAQTSAPQEQHRSLTPDQIDWRAVRPGFWTAAVDGDPSVPDQPYSLMLKLADGEWILPHWHPRAKRVVVMSGTLLMGMGASLDRGAATAQPAGSFTLVPAGTRHYEGARGETVLLLYGTGPLTTTFVSPP